MKRFKELKVEFKPEVMKEVVQKLISEFELVVSTELPNTKINLPTAEEVLNDFDEAIGNSRKRIELKGLRRRQQAEKCAQDQKKDCERSRYGHNEDSNMADNMKLVVVAYVPYQGLAYFQHIRPVIVDLLMDAEAREVAHVESNHEAAQEDDAMDTSEWNDHCENFEPFEDEQAADPIGLRTGETDLEGNSATEQHGEQLEVAQVSQSNFNAMSPQETLMDSTDPQDVGDKPEDEDQDLLKAVQNGVDLAADGTTQAETPHAPQPVDKVQDEKLDVFSRHTLSQGYYTSYYIFVRLI
ncbi:unnamed protein product [Caenorhabditis brenneri]